jgi:hypothetical protein
MFTAVFPAVFWINALYVNVKMFVLVGMYITHTHTHTHTHIAALSDAERHAAVEASTN